MKHGQEHQCGHYSRLNVNTSTTSDLRLSTKSFNPLIIYCNKPTKWVGDFGRFSRVYRCEEHKFTTAWSAPTVRWVPFDEFITRRVLES